MMHKPAHKDTVNPPGQIVNPIPNMEKPLQEHIEDYKKYTEAHDLLQKIKDNYPRNTEST